MINGTGNSHSSLGDLPFMGRSGRGWFKVFGLVGFMNFPEYALLGIAAVVMVSIWFIPWGDE